MNVHSLSIKPVQLERTLYDIEVDISDVFNLLDDVDEYVNSLVICDDDARRDREHLMSILRGTTALVARALSSPEAYRAAHPEN